MTCRERKMVNDKIDYLERKAEITRKTLEKERKEHRSRERLQDTICLIVLICGILLSIAAFQDFTNYLASLG